MNENQEQVVKTMDQAAEIHGLPTYSQLVEALRDSQRHLAQDRISLRVGERNWALLSKLEAIAARQTQISDALRSASQDGQPK